MMIDFIPVDSLKTLEFDKVLEEIKRYCVSDYSCHVLSDTPFFVSRDDIKKSMVEILQMKSILESGESFPIVAFERIQQDLNYLRKLNYALELEALVRIRKIVSHAYDIKSFFLNEFDFQIHALLEIVNRHSWDEQLPKLFEPILDENGLVKRTASAELNQIYKRIYDKERESQRTFSEVVKKYRDKGWLTESKESFKNGRRVLSVSAENKRKIQGIIHDESATGKTCFLEPQALVSINNDLTELEIDKRNEIRKIILKLCEALRPFTDQIQDYEYLMLRFDLIQAKAKYARPLKAIMPKLSQRPVLDLKQAYHPILFLSNRVKGLKTVPFTMALQGENRIVLISGPNAGGKSITMKAVGLIQLMAQFGLLVPVQDDSQIGVFNKIFCDIGDQQSIENELSTYSSRLTNMSQFLKNSDDQTLILIDEFGSGTDPKIGGAIAESILKEINLLKVFGVINTHYSNLKTFAYRTKGIVNAAMLFDDQSLTPTYEMKIGKPGSSFAFEVAEQSGLAKSILQYAKQKAGKNLQQTDKLLTTLQSEKRQLKVIREQMDSKQKEVDLLMKNYHRMQKEMEFKRKKMKIEKKELQLQDSARINKEVEAEIKRLKKTKLLEEAHKIRQEIRRKQQSIKEEVDSLKDDILENEYVDKGSFKPGDFVKHRSDDWLGQIERIDRNKAEIIMGSLKVTIPINELFHAKEHLEINQTKRIKTNLKSNPQDVENKLDIRGYKMKDAEVFLQEFLDQALISNHVQLKIVHGKGSGVLKKLVYQKAKEYPDIKEIWHPSDEQGGDGVSFLVL